MQRVCIHTLVFRKEAETVLVGGVTALAMCRNVVLCEKNSYIFVLLAL